MHRPPTIVVAPVDWMRAQRVGVPSNRADLEVAMYIGLGTLVLILIIVVIVLALRRA